MSYLAVSHQEKEDKRRGAITSGVIHLCLLILVLLPLLHPPDPPPGQSGVLIAFGEPDAGESGGDIATAPPVIAEADPVEADEPDEPIKEETPKKEVTKPKKKPAPVKRPKKEVQTDKNSKERAIAKEKAKAKEAAERKLRDARRAAEAEEKAKQDKIAKAKAEAKRIADAKAAEAKRIADAKAAEADKYRNIGRTAGSNSGGGDGKKPGNQGQTNGDSNGEALDGISTGNGVLGGGISGRKIVKKSRIEDRSQNTGTVNVRVCVDADGNVTSAKYTLSGSTTSNTNLIAKAVAGAKKYKFDKTDRESQCGTIKINFRVQ